MCYAIPAKLIAIDGPIGMLDYFGEQRKVLLDETDDYQIGDYVFAQGGIVVSKLEEAEALSILDTWKDIFFELKRQDQELAGVHIQNAAPNILAILQKANHGQELNRADAEVLFKLTNSHELAMLYEVANAVRQKVHGNASCVHGIIEFSNYCKNSCHYCGIRCERKISRYRMQPEEIIQLAHDAMEDYGFKAFVLQSGEDEWYDDEKLTHIVESIKKMGALVFLSIGIRSVATYQKLYQAGARAALMRFETANSATFEKLRPQTSFNERIALLKELKKIGYIIATGFIVGFPEETTNNIIDNLVLTRSFKPDMYSFGPFIPATDTPLASHAMLTKDEILKVIAVARLMDRDSNILVTTALETLDSQAKREGLLAGANSLMINLTPLKYREQYAIYDNRACKLELKDAIDETTKLLFSLGRAPTDLSINV